MTTALLTRARLYAIIDTGYLGGRTPEFYARELVSGGADVVQLRAKGCSAAEVAAMGKAILPILREGGVPLIINDLPDVALAVNADGVHVGQDDMPVREARARAAGPTGRKVLVGKSTHSAAQALAAAEEGADYIGFGPLFATPTKPDYSPIGLDDIRTVSAEVAIPVFCIGGIKLENLNAVMSAGCRRAVVVSGILGADSPSSYCRALRTLLGGKG